MVETVGETVQERSRETREDLLEAAKPATCPLLNQTLVPTLGSQPKRLSLPSIQSPETKPHFLQIHNPHPYIHNHLHHSVILLHLLPSSSFFLSSSSSSSSSSASSSAFASSLASPPKRQCKRRPSRVKSTVSSLHEKSLTPSGLFTFKISISISTSAFIIIHS